jgi:hypothetical protein
MVVGFFEPAADFYVAFGGKPSLASIEGIVLLIGRFRGIAAHCKRGCVFHL